MASMKRGVGYCENTDCEDYAKGVFLLNHGDTFYCPRCRQLGKVEKERGFYTTEPFSEPEVFEFPEGIGPVEGVDVEDVRELEGAPGDPSLAALGLARSLRDADSGLMPKVLADGALTRRLTVKAHKFSKKAIEVIQAAGGACEVIAR